MLRLKKLFHKKRCGKATCHVVLPLPPLSTAVETSMAAVLMVVELWGLETIHECKVSLMWVCARVRCVYLPNRLYLETECAIKLYMHRQPYDKFTNQITDFHSLSKCDLCPVNLLQ